MIQSGFPEFWSDLKSDGSREQVCKDSCPRTVPIAFRPRLFGRVLVLQSPYNKGIKRHLAQCHKN